MASAARPGAREHGSHRGPFRARSRVRRRGTHPVREGRQRLRRDPRRRPGRQGLPRAAPTQPRPAARAHRRHRRGGDHADGRPGHDHRPHRIAAGRHPQHGARLLGRPHVRRRHDGRHDAELGDHGRRLRRRPRRWRREHVASPHGRGHGPQPALPRRPHRRPRRAEHGCHGREPPRPLPPPDQGAGRRVRARLAAEDGPRVRSRAGSSPISCPVAMRSAEQGWGLLTADEGPRPGTTLEGLAGLKTPFRPHGRVTAGNSSGLNDGATAALLAAESVADELGLQKKMRMVGFAFAGVAPEIMGVGPVPSTEKALARAGLSIEDIDLFEVNEAFAVQVLAFLDHFGIADDDPRVNPMGGAIAVGHPLASSGIRLMTLPRARLRAQPAGPLRHHDDVHRAGHGRHRDLGERQLRREQGMSENASPEEVVTHARVRLLDMPRGAGRMALITIDNDRDHTRPSTFGPARAGVLRCGARHRAGPGRRDGRHRGRRRDRQAVHLRGGCRPLGDRPGQRPRGRALVRQARSRRLPPPRRDGRPDVRLRQRRGHGRRHRARAALHLPDHVHGRGRHVAARGVPRPDPGLGRRVAAAQPDRAGERPRGDHRQPVADEQADEAQGRTAARRRRRAVRAGRLPRGVHPVGRRRPDRRGHRRARSRGPRELGRHRRLRQGDARRQDPRRDPGPLQGAGPRPRRPDVHALGGVRRRGRRPGRPGHGRRPAGVPLRLRPRAEARQEARRRPGQVPRSQGDEGRHRRCRAHGQPARAAVRQAAAGAGRHDRPRPGPRRQGRATTCAPTWRSR